MFRILALVLLVSALIVPRAAWGAHLSGHDDLSAVGAEHSHHGDYTHEHDDDGQSTDEALGNADSEEGGLTHDHSPSFAISSAVMLPEVSALPILQLMGLSKVDFERLGISLSHPESLLRPPRAI